MRDRLIELLRNSSHEVNTRCVGDCGFCADKIADDILADGWMRPPVKVGQTLYVIYEYYEKEVYRVVVSAIRMDCKKNGNRFCVRGTFHVSKSYAHEYQSTFKFESIGKTVFLTREEAEKAMRGGEQ